VGTCVTVGAPEERPVIDLDSHLMEPVGYLASHAAAEDRDRLALTIAAGVADDDPEWSAPGAFDRAERAAWLDAQGITRQLVLPGASHVQFLGTPLVIEAARAQHRAALAWADGDPRFVMAACIPVDVPISPFLVEEAAAAGFGVVLLITGEALPPAPTAMADLWAALEATGTVGVFHFGTTGTGLPAAWRNGGRDDGEAADPIDVVCAHHGAEAIVSRLALSGVFDRRPGLRLLFAEHGASWLPGCLIALDACQRAFRSRDSTIPDQEPLSAQVRRAVTVTPFAFEPVGDLIDRVGADVLAFATDHPHPEGGRDPANRFRLAIGDRDSTPFFSSNAIALLG
jgi:predicted TIM-barrel fold metal-dependent hydrolase